jgi:hypothetical protein
MRLKTSMIGFLEDREKCNGKNCYNKKEAITAANYSFNKRGAKLRIYHCEDCGHWHLTHQVENEEEIEIEDEEEIQLQ